MRIEYVQLFRGKNYYLFDEFLQISLRHRPSFLAYLETMVRPTEQKNRKHDLQSEKNRSLLHWSFLQTAWMVTIYLMLP